MQQPEKKKKINNLDNNVKLLSLVKWWMNRPFLLPML
jgi:hypothetical protein